MKFTGTIGKYQFGQTIGEGTFAKVKLGKNIFDGQPVAIKIIEKKMILENNLMYQVQREIRTMKLLNHPNIVRIYEVLGSKTRIYIVMEYVPGGQLSDKLSYTTRLSEKEARKLFQQLIDAVEYCHCKGVYHRDIKPQNLLLDSKGNLKVSDFGLSALQKPGSMLTTACGSPCYVAPELIRNQGYDGAAADVWACGVVLYEMLAGYLPFTDQNLAILYKKILESRFRCPEWFTESQKKLISRTFVNDPKQRITMLEIIEDEWFQQSYEPAEGIEFVENVNSNHDHVATIDPVEENTAEKRESPRSSFINAFQLIALSQPLDLSHLFEEKDDENRKIMLGSKHNITETIDRIEAAARDSCLTFERMKNSKIKMSPKQNAKSYRSCANLMVDVIEVAPTDCVVKISKSTGELRIYQEFCQSLSSLLEEPCNPLLRQTSKDDSIIGTFTRTESSKDMADTGSRWYFSS